MVNGISGYANSNAAWGTTSFYAPSGLESNSFADNGIGDTTDPSAAGDLNGPDAEYSSMEPVDSFQEQSSMDDLGPSPQDTFEPSWSLDGGNAPDEWLMAA